MITIAPEDPCGPGDKLEACGLSMLEAIADFFTTLYDKTDVDELVGLEDILACLADVTKQLENDEDLESAESKYADMDPAYSFTIKCERLPS